MGLKQGPIGYDKQERNKGRFGLRPDADEPLGKKPVSVRMPESYADKIHELPPLIKSEWLRRIIKNAVDNGDFPSDY